MYGDCVLSRERNAQRHLSFDDVAKTNLLSQDPNSMVQLREKQNFSGFKHHAKVHSFRIITAILTWVLLGATLFYKPEWIRSALRTGTRAIEGVGDELLGRPSRNRPARARGLSLDTDHGGDHLRSVRVVADRCRLAERRQSRLI